MNKTNEELNRALHTGMGLIGHKVELYNKAIKAYIKEEYFCTKCLSRRYHGNFNWPCNAPIPNYCESLDVVKIVRDFTIERVGKDEFGLAANNYILRVFRDLNADDDEWDISLIGIADVLSLTARQIAEICHSLLNGDKDA